MKFGTERVVLSCTSEAFEGNRAGGGLAPPPGSCKSCKKAQWTGTPSVEEEVDAVLPLLHLVRPLLRACETWTTGRTPRWAGLDKKGLVGEGVAPHPL